MMIDIIILFLVAIFSGMLIGKNHKRPIIGFSIALLSGASIPFILLTLSNIAKSKIVILNIIVLCFETPNSYGYFQSLYPQNIITDQLIYILIAAVLVMAIAMYFIAFCCRAKANKLYLAIFLSLLGGVIVIIGSILGLFSMLTLVILFIGESASMFKFSVIALVIFSVILTIFWSIYNWLNKKTGEKVLLIQISVLASCYLILWLFSLTSAYLYAQYVHEKAIAKNIKPQNFQREAPTEVKQAIAKINKFHKKHPKFAIPVNSVNFWTPNHKPSETVSQQDREYTIRLFNTSETKDFFDGYDEIIKYHMSNPVDSLHGLNYVRAYARNQLGHAALFLETNRPEKILPELMKITIIDEKILTNTPLLIAELTKIACRKMWYYSLISIGPDGEQYVPIYRNALNFIKSRSIRVPSNAEYYLYKVENTKVANLKVKNLYFLYFPVFLARDSKSLSYSMKVQSILNDFENSKFFETAQEMPYPLNVYQQVAARGRESIIIGSTVIAIKLYRSEHGIFPNSLEQLIPDYLDNIPRCPTTNKLIEYKFDGQKYSIQIPAIPPNMPSLTMVFENNY